MKPQNSAADVLQGVQSAPSRIDGFPVNCPRTGKLRAERGSLRTASRTNQSNKVTHSRLRACCLREVAQFCGVRRDIGIRVKPETLGASAA